LVFLATLVSPGYYIAGHPAGDGRLPPGQLVRDRGRRKGGRR